MKENGIVFPMNKLRRWKYDSPQVNKEYILCVEMEQHGLQIFK